MVQSWKVAVRLCNSFVIMYVSNFKTFVILFPRPSLTSVSSWSGRCWSFGCFFQPKDLTGWGTFGRGAQESYAFQVFGSGKSLGTQLKHTSMRFHELQSLAMHVLPPVWSCMISWSLSPVQKNLKHDKIAILMYVCNDWIMSSNWFLSVPFNNLVLYCWVFLIVSPWKIVLTFSHSVFERYWYCTFSLVLK